LSTWAEKVVNEERIRLFHSQLGKRLLEGQELADHRLSSMYPIQDQPEILPDSKLESDKCQIDDLHLFSQGCSKAYLEGPLERFLTEDGCSDPPYFTRRVLGNKFGSAESIPERREKAKRNMQMAIQRRPPSSES
jgi:hypothetical protein